MRDQPEPSDECLCQLKRDEYNALRQEMERTSQYVFERPLLIISVGVAAFAVGDKVPQFVAWLPPIVVGLLIFNLWFTIDRVYSLSRIAAYIDLQFGRYPRSDVLKKPVQAEWIGWETSLREFRIWMRETENCREKAEQRSGDRGEDTIPLAAGYYPLILTVHWAATIVALGASLAMFLKALMALYSKLAEQTSAGIPAEVWQALHGLLAYVAVGLGVLVLLKMTGEYSCRKMAKCIEETRIIWLAVFKEYNRKNKKRPGPKSESEPTPSGADHTGGQIDQPDENKAQDKSSP